MTDLPKIERLLELRRKRAEAAALMLAKSRTAQMQARAGAQEAGQVLSDLDAAEAQAERRLLASGTGPMDISARQDQAVLSQQQRLRGQLDLMRARGAVEAARMETERLSRARLEAQQAVTKLEEAARHHRQLVRHHAEIRAESEMGEIAITGFGARWKGVAR